MLVVKCNRTVSKKYFLPGKSPEPSDLFLLKLSYIIWLAALQRKMNIFPPTSFCVIDVHSVYLLTWNAYLGIHKQPRPCGQRMLDSHSLSRRNSAGKALGATGGVMH